MKSPRHFDHGGTFWSEITSNNRSAGKKVAHRGDIHAARAVPVGRMAACGYGRVLSRTMGTAIIKIALRSEPLFRVTFVNGPCSLNVTCRHWGPSRDGTKRM